MLNEYYVDVPVLVTVKVSALNDKIAVDKARELAKRKMDICIGQGEWDWEETQPRVEEIPQVDFRPEAYELKTV